MTPYLCTFGVVLIASIITLLAGSLGARDPCGWILGASALFAWSIALRLALLCERNRHVKDHDSRRHG
jgi:hypothetical protein